MTSADQRGGLLGGNHAVDRVHDPVANLDVVLLERHAVHLASGARDGGPAGGGEGLALGHVREGHRALDDVVLDDVGQRLVRHEVNLGGAELLGELDEGVVVGAEDGDGARAGQEALAVGLRRSSGSDGVSVSTSSKEQTVRKTSCVEVRTDVRG